MQNDTKNGFTKTHDGQLVYPSGSELPDFASGWIQCDNHGAAYSTWLDEADCARATEDRKRIAAEAKKLRTRAQCEAALRALHLEECQIGGTCKSMRLTYEVTMYRDLWPLRQVSR